MYNAQGASRSRQYGQDVRYNFDKNTDFSKFKTYKWVAVKDAGKVDDLLDKQIKAIVTSQLVAKGLTQVDDDSANLFLAYQVGIGQEKQSHRTVRTGAMEGAGIAVAGTVAARVSARLPDKPETIYIGQLAVDMYDSSNHDLVWRGLASKTIDKKAKPDKQEKNLTKAVAKLLKNYHR